MAPRNQTTANNDNLELILYRLDELREMFDRNSKQQAEAAAAGAKAHRENTIAIVKLESKVLELEKDFVNHFKEKAPKKNEDNYIKVILAVVSFLGTILAAYIAIKVG